MLEQLGRRRPLRNVHLEAAVEEVLQLRRVVADVLHLRLAVGGDQVEGAQGRLVEVRRLAADHLDHHDAEAPDVNLVAVGLPASGRTAGTVSDAHRRHA